MGLADARPSRGLGLRLRSLGSRLHGRVPKNQAAATVAGEQFALAKLVPRLRANAHAAAGALLIVDAYDSRAAGAGEPVVANKNLRLDERAKDLAFNVEDRQCGVELLLTARNAGADFFQRRGQGFHTGARRGQCRFLGLGALQAGEVFALQPLGFGIGESDFVLDGRGLLRSLYGVELGAEARDLLAMRCNLAIEPRAQQFFPRQRIGSVGGMALGRGESCRALCDFGGERAQRQGKASALQIHVLQLYEVFNLR